MSAESFRILAVVSDSGHAKALNEAIKAAGGALAGQLESAEQLLLQAAEHEFDILLLDVARLQSSMIRELRTLRSVHPVPIIVFAETADTATIERAVEAGVDTFIVGGFNPSRLKSIIDIAISRFRNEQKLRDTLQKTQIKLEDRKWVHRATGRLMEQHQLSEEEAYRQLRKVAMQQRRNLGDIAREYLKTG